MPPDPVAVLRDLGITVPPGLPAERLAELVRVVTTLWVDGRAVPRDEFRIDPFDEGLLYGRGVWESTRTTNGAPWLWPLHTERLLRTAAMLGFAVAPERLPTTTQVTDFVRSLTTSDVVVRLNATAGSPGRPGAVWLSAWLQQAPAADVKLRTVRSPVAKGQPHLIGKTFEYAHRLWVGRAAATDGFDSALLTDDAGNVLEAAHANVFVRLPAGWVTPAADGGLLPGTVRQFLLKHAPLPIREAPLPLAALADATEVFVTNSNAGIVPVTRIDGREFPVGPETRQLLRWLHPDPADGPKLRFAIG